ncbi:hypothetical protein LEP1GSC046_0729 [Leptospira kirschneri serovar Bim str. 1051]|nr:hypothetical protein LEP1GSC046_0729 [Leptospira kirschneri serovar Bim str. 1051]
MAAKRRFWAGIRRKTIFYSSSHITQHLNESILTVGTLTNQGFTS